MNLIIKKLERLKKAYENGEIPVLSEHEVHPELKKNSRENYLYFTLPVAINFQRNSPALWKAAFETWNDEKTRYLFYPEQCVKQPIEKVQTDLLKHKLALQKNKHVYIWTSLQNTFYKYYESDPKYFFNEGNWDVVKVTDALQKTYKKRFPYLSGIKLSNYWVFILSKYTDARFSGMNELSIIPDTHIIQASKQLGIVDSSATSVQVDEAWKKLLENTPYAPIDFHSMLWNWSRAHFKPRV